ncbi:hypothetical protein KP509_07G083300 [Ceratopteris richardii]|nr:hypothetical protein KP509_07G083300 [Ceratopteris richardii]
MRDEKRKVLFSTPQGKRSDIRSDRDRDWERDTDMDRDSDLTYRSGSHKKKSIPAPLDGEDQPIDPDEPTYCICGQVSFGDMIACDNENCEGGEWFHYQCVGLSSESRFKGKWYCPTCKVMQRRRLLDPPA